jgi:peptidoglycan hydrolase-like protein with peptidoglycan-binding domain
MSIIDSIRKARSLGIEDEEILKEIIKQNPEKGVIFEEKIRKGIKASQIIEEIIQEVKKQEEEERILEAKKRIELLKKIKETKQEATKSFEQKSSNNYESSYNPTPINPTPINPTPITSNAPEERNEQSFKPTPDFSEKKDIKIANEKLTKEYSKETISPPSLPKDVLELTKPLPPKLSGFGKLWIRIFIFVLVLSFLSGIGTFWYWYFVIKRTGSIATSKGGCVENRDCPIGFYCGNDGVCREQPIQECTIDDDCKENYICGPEKTCIEKPKQDIVAPESLFPIENITEYPIDKPDEIKIMLAKSLKEWLDQGQFRRIIIKNNSENKIIGLKEFIDYLKIRTPEGFLETLDNNFTLFIYSQKEGNRLGFATKIFDKNKLEYILINQENKIKEDYKTFFNLLVEEKPPLFPYFRNSRDVKGYTGPNFRYQTLDSKDIGINYLISDNYFVFTSSWESMKEVIKRLNIPIVKTEITSELKIGDEGYQVKLLQVWLQEEPLLNKPPITGLFGKSTQKAVIEFQEKYANEILAPQGLSKGTGIVDEYTRRKLNELYSDKGKIPPVEEITQELRFESRGEEVKILQKWLNSDNRIRSKIGRQIPISGWFDPATKTAVTVFQELYADEILKPQGLSKGTGIVDNLTRKKLNELFKK